MTTSTLPLLLALIMTGFMGSWHCGVMCGPIAVSIDKNQGLFLYHFGRFTSYLLIGALAGFLGSKIIFLPSLPLRFACALLMSILYILSLRKTWLHNWTGTQKLFRWLHSNKPGQFLFGVSTVLLPCGWLWTFIAAAIAAGSAWSGTLILFVLWVTSLPALSVMNLYFRKTLPFAAAKKQRFLQIGLFITGLYAIWSHFVLSLF